MSFLQMRDVVPKKSGGTDTLERGKWGEGASALQHHQRADSICWLREHVSSLTGFNAAGS